MLKDFKSLTPTQRLLYRELFIKFGGKFKMDKLFKMLIASVLLFTMIIPVNTFASGIQPLDMIGDDGGGAIERIDDLFGGNILSAVFGLELADSAV